MAVGHRRQNASWASAGLLLALLLHVITAQRPQSIADTGGGTQRQQQQLQLLLQQQQLQQQQQQQRGRFRQRARTPVVSDNGAAAAAAARQRVFTPSRTVSSLFNPAQRRQNNPLFRNRQRVSFLRPKTAPPPPPPQIVTRPPRPTPTTTAKPSVRPFVPPPSPPPPPPPPTTVETTFAYEEGVAHVSKGENPTLVTLGKHDPGEDYSEALDELDDQVSNLHAHK